MAKKTDRSIQWKHYLLELFVVFFGVMSAFILNGWRESRQEEQLEENYLISVASDLQKDQESLQEIISLTSEHMRILNKFLSDRGEGWTDDSTATVIVNSMSMIRFDGKTSTYESMKFSGHLNLIDNFDLRNQIVDYYESFATAEVIEEVYSFWITETLTPYYIENLDMSSFEIAESGIINQKRFQNQMFGYNALIRQNVEAYKNLFDANKMLLDQVTEYTETQ